MRIGVSGSQSSGKTTLLNAMKAIPAVGSLEYLLEMVRSFHVKGLKVNEDGDLNTQQAVIAGHILNLLTRDNYVVDRTLLDGVVYTRYHYIYDEGVIPEWFMTYCEHVLEQNISLYDYVFYLPAEIPLVDDGFRSLNLDYRKKISDLFEAEIDRLRDRGIQNIYTLTGSVEDRVTAVKNILHRGARFGF